MTKGLLTLEQRARQNAARLKTTNVRLRARIVELEATVVTQQAQLQTQALQIAELQTMVFGKKKHPPTGHGAPMATLLPSPTGYFQALARLG